MSHRSPLVSVLILNYRSGKTAVECALSFERQTLMQQMEILVIDNHSEDDSIGILRNRLRGHPQVRIVETRENGGFGRGYNQGARLARGEYLLINNPDKRLPPDGVERLVSRMEADPSIGILGPKMVHPDGSRRLSMRRDPRAIDILARRSFLGRLFPGILRRYLMLDADPEKPHKAEWVVGGSFLIRRDLFEKLGGFDERFFLFFEDADLCRRCRALGKGIVYDPSVVATDRRRRLSGESLADLLLSPLGRIHIVSAVKYFLKWGMGKSSLTRSRGLPTVSRL